MKPIIEFEDKYELEEWLNRTKADNVVCDILEDTRRAIKYDDLSWLDYYLRNECSAEYKKEEIIDILDAFRSYVYDKMIKHNYDSDF